MPKLLGAVFLYSGFYKLFYPGEATLALQTLGLPSWLATFTVTLVLMLELYLGVLLVSGISLRYAIAFATVILTGFTGYLFYLSTLAHPPSCGCLGLSGIFSSARQAALFGLIRNCFLLWGLKFAYDLRFGHNMPPSVSNV
jgi:uncharacterized membrane protein YphA (DoxX/SURF4 family)